jgi:ATP-dependent RNA helicase DDX1
MLVAFTLAGFGYGGTGKKSHARQFDTYGEEYSKGDVIGCLLDATDGVITFSKNGTIFEPAFQLPQYLRGQVLYPAICLKNAEMVLNFGDSAFKFGPPDGYVGLSQAPADVTASAAAAAAVAASKSSERLPLCLVLEPSRYADGFGENDAIVQDTFVEVNRDYHCCCVVC